MKIELGYLEIDVDFDYQPEESATYWYPGAPESVEITFCGGKYSHKTGCRRS